MNKHCKNCLWYLPQLQGEGVCDFPTPRWVDFYGGYGEIKEGDNFADKCEVFITTEQNFKEREKKWKYLTE